VRVILAGVALRKAEEGECGHLDNLSRFLLVPWARAPATRVPWAQSGMDAPGGGISRDRVRLPDSLRKSVFPAAAGW
jgi:hypothetical protein